MKILINAFGIQDSGGLTVFEKVLEEFLSNQQNKYFIICNDSPNINLLFNKYKKYKCFVFIIIQNKGFLYRLYYENFVFRTIIKKKEIELIYNFSGSSQLFMNTPQLIKIQNLLFYCKKLDVVYKKKNQIVLWLKQIYLKRIVFKVMVNNSKYFEIQSSHVEKYLSDYIDTKNKFSYIKSDIDVSKNLFLKPKKYNLENRIKFLYIVGPHFEIIHKNFNDFTNAMLNLQKEGLDFEINITLTREQLQNSEQWNNDLNKNTNFLGYVSDKSRMKELFSDNTILISTSIIETLGLHIIEGIKNGVITVAPKEKYSKSVYGDNIISYELFNDKSLSNSIFSIIEDKIDSENYIYNLQNDLKRSENSKYQTIIDIFNKVKNVQK